MSDLRKAAEMALETLCVAANDAVPNDIDERFEQAIQALRQALAQPEWVGLTKDDIDSWDLPDSPTVFQFVRFIEAKLKEKNG